MNDFNNYTPNTPPVPPQAPMTDEAKVYNREKPIHTEPAQGYQAPPSYPQAQPAPQQYAPQRPAQPQYTSQPYSAQQGYSPQYTAPPQYNPPQGAPVPPNGYPSNPNYAYTPKAPKQPMSSGAKAFVIIAVALLSVSLIGFIVYTAMNTGNSGFKPDVRSTDSFNYTLPSEINPYATEEPTVSSDKKYDESDLSKETNPKFKGLKLNKKPSNKKNYGTNYAFKNVEKSVVGIICYTDDQQGTATSFTSMGSGMVISSDGYILTNAHIINNSRTAYKIKIVTADKKEYKAGVVGYDSRYDLAVLKADAKNLKPVTFGDSAEIEIAEDVIVVGNPRSLNYQNSVTKGIVSAVNRQVSLTNNARFIQTDAAINPGNSGGPLTNMYGQVIGIATSKIAQEEYEGMCFAIPSVTAKKVADDIIKYSYVKNRVKIGIVGTIATEEENGASGIIIEEISKGGPLDGTGAKVGDIMTKVDGKKISTFAEVYDILEKHKAGEKIKITLYRKDTSKTYDVTITLKEDKT